MSAWILGVSDPDFKAVRVYPDHPGPPRFKRSGFPKKKRTAAVRGRSKFKTRFYPDHPGPLLFKAVRGAKKHRTAAVRVGLEILDQLFFRKIFAPAAHSISLILEGKSAL